MSAAIKNILTDLEKRLESEIYDSTWHQKKFREAEQIILELKETIDGLREVESKL
jgi:hypothetical protein